MALCLPHFPSRESQPHQGEGRQSKFRKSSPPGARVHSSREQQLGREPGWTTAGDAQRRQTWFSILTPLLKDEAVKGEKSISLFPVLPTAAWNFHLALIRAGTRDWGLEGPFSPGRQCWLSTLSPQGEQGPCSSSAQMNVFFFPCPQTIPTPAMFTPRHSRASHRSLMSPHSQEWEKGGPGGGDGRESTPAWTRGLESKLDPFASREHQVKAVPGRPALQDPAKWLWGEAPGSPLGLGVPRSIIQIQSFSLKAKVRMEARASLWKHRRNKWWRYCAPGGPEVQTARHGMRTTPPPHPAVPTGPFSTSASLVRILYKGTDFHSIGQPHEGNGRTGQPDVDDSLGSSLIFNYLVKHTATALVVSGEIIVDHLDRSIWKTGILNRSYSLDKTDC